MTRNPARERTVDLLVWPLPQGRSMHRRQHSVLVLKRAYSSPQATYGAQTCSIRLLED